MSTNLPDSLLDQLRRAGVIAVLVIDDVADAIPLAQALFDGGVRVMELTLRTPVALQALRQIREHVPEMIAGVGTVLTTAQVHEVSQAGAAFAVAPGMNPQVVRESRSCGLPFAPGVCTPSDIEAAIEQGCQIMKFFPAEPSGGLSYLRSIAAPYLHLNIQFIPLGGLNELNAGEWLASPLIAAVGGSWLAPRELIRESNWPEIRLRAATATRLVEQIRSLHA